MRATVKSYCVLQLLRRQIPRNVTQAVSTQGGVSLCENKAKELLSKRSGWGQQGSLPMHSTTQHQARLGYTQHQARLGYAQHCMVTPIKAKLNSSPPCNWGLATKQNTAVPLFDITPNLPCPGGSPGQATKGP